MPLNSAIEILYTPQDYECKLLYQTWQHLIQADSKKIMESCDDPPILTNNPITLTRLIDPGSHPPLSPRYYAGCNLIALFHIMSRSTLNNHLFDRFLVLSIGLPDSAYPTLPSNQIQDDVWPDSNQYELDNDTGRTTRIQGTIWQAHRLKALPTKSNPVLLDSIILPTPIESLRFRTSLDTVNWSEPEHFHPDDNEFINFR